jgi:monoamine oxidase
MNFEINKVYTFKLNSGEEMVAKVVAAPIQAEYVKIEDPVSIAPGPQGMGLVPSMFTADLGTEIRLNIASVAMYALTEDGVRMKYLEATTGIKVPEKKIVLG